jgi:hypothetical protein
MMNYPKGRPHRCINTSIEKVFQNSMVTTKSRITIQLPFKPNLIGYEIKLKCLMLPLSSMFCCRYNKNYNIKMFIKELVIMNKVFFSLSNGCHMDLVAIS